MTGCGPAERVIGASPSHPEVAAAGVAATGARCADPAALRCRGRHGRPHISYSSPDTGWSVMVRAAARKC
ncbi:MULTISPECIES: hypothetical protein [unclassified Frankia]|uniref:hypothetical protein n=1 Tax=unclassified Frankia TaxID=2632575 RepID=UPI002AD4B967|nr:MULTISPECIES: hypothetical protein [unclassified Frankia]